MPYPFNLIIKWNSGSPMALNVSLSTVCRESKVQLSISTGDSYLYMTDIIWKTGVMYVSKHVNVQL